ncbi:serine hydroxymethyltransferase [candidate division NPL-UPA2 bacterium]|nr:serine hydroxymethyltransferase [candidate division NPL-UPA2 bacterium]
MRELKRVDPEIAEVIHLEEKREEEKLNLIASENYASRAVLEAQGSVLTNKYAEGYPGERYYAGCEFVDRAESLAIERAKKLFAAEHVNVQPHSGSQANMAVYFAVLKPGDTLLGMDLAQGGHLTHGSPVNFSGMYFQVVSYGVDRKTELIDFSRLRRLAREHKPRLLVAGASAYPRTLNFQVFREIADEVGAYLLADIAHIAGLVVAKIHPDPILQAQFVTTTTHKTLRGPRGGMIMCAREFGERIDKMVFPGIQGGPLMQVVAAKAVAFKEAESPEFREYQKQTVKNARALAEGLEEKGFRLVSGGTDTHLILVDLTAQGITGREAERALDRAGITVNKNNIPFDRQPPAITSGIRLGTPALTTRGMKAGEMRTLAGMINEVLKKSCDDKVRDRVREEVKELCGSFPLHKKTSPQRTQSHT